MYLRVSEGYIVNNSRTGHPPLHPGGQGSGVPHQQGPPPVVRRRGPQPLPVIRVALPVFFNIPPPHISYLPLLGGKSERKAQGTFHATHILSCHDTVISHWGGGVSFHISPPWDLHRQ